jgi:hypothetical protein
MMARPIRSELRYAAGELQRFFKSQNGALKHLEHRTEAAFLNGMLSKSTGGTGEEDPALSCVGRFYWQLNQIDRAVAEEKRVGRMTKWRYDRKREQILFGLNGFLRGAGII